ncbi:MAG TPA: SCO family protein [Vicinamibacterales bacterium]|nr:SCO family protein [Vicinamibacterales bacterium]
MAALLASVWLVAGSAFAQQELPPPPESSPVSKTPAILQNVGIDQRIGNQVPLDLTFMDENAHEVRLGSFFGKRPVVLVLAYYDCPMLCTQVLNGTVGALRTLSFEPGRDYEFVVVSIDPRETPRLAWDKKATYVRSFGRSDAQAGFHFLTGKDENIHALASAVGFRYKYDKEIDQYAHAAGFEVLTPRGLVSQYFYGIDFAPRDLRFALIQSSGNKLGSVVDQVILLCYHYDPATGKYGARIIDAVRIGGIAVLLALVGFIVISLRRERAAQAHHIENRI